MPGGEDRPVRARGNNSRAKWNYSKYSLKTISCRESSIAAACYLCNTLRKRRGVNTVWTPVKGLAFTADINVTRLDQKNSGTVTVPLPGLLSVAKPSAVCELRDQTGVSMLLRAQRNW
jgi:hypothetical protein